MIETWESIREMAEGVGEQQWPQPPTSKEAKQIPGVGKARWSFLNCQGIRKKLEDLKGLLHREKFGITDLVETWIMPGQNVEMEGYKWIGVERERERSRSRRSRDFCKQ